MAFVESCGSAYALMEDEEVVQLARNGSDRATEYVLARYRPMVESKARHYYFLGADHEDVVQEGMIGLCKAIRDYREDRLGKFRPFAELCVTRQIISAVKAAQRHKHALLNESISLNQSFGHDDADGSLMDVLPNESSQDPEKALFGRAIPPEVSSTLQASLSRLERQVLINYLEGKSYKEISEAVPCRFKAVDNALQRVKRKLGSLLEG